MVVVYACNFDDGLNKARRGKTNSSSQPKESGIKASLLSLMMLVVYGSISFRLLYQSLIAYSFLG